MTFVPGSEAMAQSLASGLLACARKQYASEAARRLAAVTAANPLHAEQRLNAAFKVGARGHSVGMPDDRSFHPLLEKAAAVTQGGLRSHAVVPDCGFQQFLIGATNRVLHTSQPPIRAPHHDRLVCWRSCRATLPWQWHRSVKHTPSHRRWGFCDCICCLEMRRRPSQGVGASGHAACACSASSDGAGAVSGCGGMLVLRVSGPASNRSGGSCRADVRGTITGLDWESTLLPGQFHR